MTVAPNITKQRRWQLNKLSQGLCLSCGWQKLKSKFRCKECLKKAAKAKEKK